MHNVPRHDKVKDKQWEGWKKKSQKYFCTDCIHFLLACLIFSKYYILQGSFSLKFEPARKGGVISELLVFAR